MRRPLAVLALAAWVSTACGVEVERPSFRAGAPRECPERMVRVPRMPTCIDRLEARIVDGRALPAIEAPPDDRLVWEQADRACRAAGYRLCTLAEFEQACAGPARVRAFPYGNEHVPRRCNIAERDDDLDARRIAPSGSHSECRTPEGVFDLSGNVMEWLADEGPGGGIRALRGGSAFQPASSAGCIAREGGWLAAQEQGGGLRCCISLRP